MRGVYDAETLAAKVGYENFSIHNLISKSNKFEIFNFGETQLYR